MLYQKSKEEVLEEELFQNPTSEYRAAPFWAWNCKLDKDKLTEEIPQMKKMGMGGFHIHCRVGLDTEYLGEEFFECVHACEEKGREVISLLNELVRKFCQEFEENYKK